MCQILKINIVEMEDVECSAQSNLGRFQNEPVDFYLFIS